MDTMNPLSLSPKILLALVLLGALGAGLAAFLRPAPDVPGAQDIRQATFARLNSIRAQKKQEVIDYLTGMQKQIAAADQDEVLLDCFRAYRAGTMTAEQEYQLDVHYVSVYGSFYDILFIDSHGYVFHSIKQEADYRQNIFSSGLSGQRFVQALKKQADDPFFDFEYYQPSAESAAFFPVPIKQEGRFLGWLLFQCASNKVNAILADRRALGRSGEVYLVNSDSLMLSDSRFMADSTILRQKVETQAVREAFRTGRGEKIIDDYRGVRVFSSFERFKVLGSEWMILVEIDESEVLTDYYRQHKAALQDKLIAAAAGQPRQPARVPASLPLRRKRVDINEYARAAPGEALTTVGVATCTAVAILHPGQFAYLTHIAPGDAVYFDAPAVQDEDSRRQGFRQNFLEKVLRKVRHYEIYPSQLRDLEFVIVAPHHASFAGILDTLLEQGIELTQIRFLYNPRARSANILWAPLAGLALVEWNGAEGLNEEMSGGESLGAVLKGFIYDSNL